MRGRSMATEKVATANLNTLKKGNDYTPTGKMNAELLTHRRSLSAGRAPQKGADDIIRSVYNKLGVSRNDLLTGGDDSKIIHNSNLTYNSNRLDDSQKTLSNTTKCVGDQQPSVAPWIRGRQSPDSSSAKRLDSDLSDNNNQRRARSLSQGRKNRWPAISFPSGGISPVNTPARKNSATTGTRNANDSSSTSTNGTNIRNASSPTFSRMSYTRSEQRVVNDKFCEEKKLDETMSTVNSFDEPEDSECTSTPPPSVRERLRLYGGSVLDQKNSKSNVSVKNVTTNYTNRVSRGNPAKTYLPKINIFEECNQKLYDSVNDTDDQISTSHSEVVAQHAQMSNSPIPLTKSMSNHHSGYVSSRTTSLGETSGSKRSNKIANAFLTAIATKSEPNNNTVIPSSLFEIQTTEDSERQFDSLSISLSSVSADEYQRQNLSPAPSGADNFSRHYHTGDNRRLHSPNNLQHERNRVSVYNHGSNNIVGGPLKSTFSRGGTSADSESCATPKTGKSTLWERHQNSLGANSVTQLHSQQQDLSRLETIIEARVNARMSEYENRMEKMIFKFMQTVDEKVSSRMKDLESRIDSYNHKIKNSSKQQLQQPALP